MRACWLIIEWLVLGKEFLERPMVRRVLVGLAMGAVVLAALRSQVGFVFLICLVVSGGAVETALLLTRTRMGEGTLILAGALIWGGVFWGFQSLYDLGSAWLLAPILIAASGDVGAMVIGRRWGTTRLPASIAGHKTVEGLVGGVLAGALAGEVYLFFLQPSNPGSAAYIALAAALAAQAIDLTGSVLKRRAGVQGRGSGSVFRDLPCYQGLADLWSWSGHGGFLDRTGSHAAAALVVAAAHWANFI